MVQIFHIKHLSQDKLSTLLVFWKISAKLFSSFQEKNIRVCSYEIILATVLLRSSTTPVLWNIFVCIWYIPHTFLIHPNHAWPNHNLLEIFHSYKLPSNYFLEFTSSNCWKFCIYKLPHPLTPQLSICTFSPADRLCSNSRPEGKA